MAEGMIMMVKLVSRFRLYPDVGFKPSIIAGISLISKKPAKYIRGTKMAYAGLRKEKDRASVIKYLNQNSDNPVQLP